MSCLTKLNFRIVENPLPEYFGNIGSRLGEETEEFLKEQASIFADITNPFVPVWNPNLSLSPEEDRYRRLVEEHNIPGIEVWYTGWTKQAESGSLPKGVTWKYGDVATKRLTHDYAQDMELKHHYVEQGVEKYSDMYHAEVVDFINKLFKKGG